MKSLNHFDPPFEIVGVGEILHPVVFNSPHSGRIYPAPFHSSSRLNALTLRRSEDSFVDELFTGAVALGCPMLKAHFPRAYLDVNREPYELDPQMFADPLPGNVNTSSLRVAGGLGTIPRIVSEHQEIYRHTLMWADAEARINSLYYPYHQALRRLISHSLAQFGWAALIDCHSMPSSVSPSHGSARPDIILGDRYASACSSAITDVLEELFVATGMSVVRNRPYAGGYITQTYGRPEQGIHALQVEVNRGLYMNEATMRKLPAFQSVANVIGAVLEAFLAELPGLTKPAREAAE